MIQLDQASVKDLNLLSEMEKKIFDYDVISPRQMRYLLNSETATVIKAQIDKDPAGYMILLRRKNSLSVRIYSLGILPQARKLGVGRHLVQFAEAESARNGFESLHLEVRMTNVPAIIFYLSYGFSIYRRKNAYYTDGSSALLLKKFIHKVL